MKRFVYGPAGATGWSLWVISLLCAVSVAAAPDPPLNIVPVKAGPFPDAAWAIVLAAEAVWEVPLADIDGRVEVECWWVDLGLEHLPPVTNAEIDHAPAGFPLAVTDSYEWNGARRPTAARIRFNGNPAIPWHFDGEPVPAGTYDFRTVALHELCHALGFAVGNPRFRREVVPNPLPAVDRTYNPGGVPGISTARLVPADLQTHLDPGHHAPDLMEPFLAAAVRLAPSPLDIGLLRHDVWGTVVSVRVLCAGPGAGILRAWWENDAGRETLWTGLPDDEIKVKNDAAGGVPIRGFFLDVAFGELMPGEKTLVLGRLPVPPPLRDDAAFALCFVDPATGEHACAYDDGAVGENGEVPLEVLTGCIECQWADANCDGSVSWDDIDPFVVALTDPALYQTAYPNCDFLNACDCNVDGNVDFDDINAFVSILSGS